MRKLLLAVLLFTSQRAHALISVMEGLPTTKGGVFVATSTPQLLLNTTFYNGAIPSVSLKASSNVVVGSDACVVYSSGSLGCTGRISGGSFSGPGLSTGVATTAALSGNGMSPTPLGVVSSSVAVLGASGYVQNFQIDPSSVNKVIGMSSSCAAGFYFSTMTLTNGVVTGGGCVAAGSGGGSSTMTITAVSDNFLGQVTGSKTSFTLSQTPANAAALSCILDGLLLSQTSDYAYTPPTTIAVTTAPAANSTGFFCNYFVNTSTLPAVFILNSSQTVSGATTNLSTTTMGPSVYSSTAIYSAITFGAPSVVLYSSFTTASSIYFYNIVSSYSYTLDCNTFLNTSNANTLLQFNGDTGSHYNYGNVFVLSNVASANVGTSSTPQGSARMNGNDNIIAGSYWVLKLNFWAQPAGRSTVTWTGTSNGLVASNNPEGGTLMGTYNGSSSLNSMRLFTSAGTLTGYCSLTATAQPMAY